MAELAQYPQVDRRARLTCRDFRRDYLYPGRPVVITDAAVGRLWVKPMRLDLADARYGELVETLYRHIAACSPDIRPLWLRPLLLISSPNALVYYHADPHPTMLWQIRGRKRVWIYPAADEKFVDNRNMEDIFAAITDEEVPYRPEYDDAARVYDLEPGEVLSWPLNAPHRVTNADCLNVSLSVPYGTERGERRGQLFLANRYLRRHFGVRAPSTREHGVAAFVKRTGFRAARRFRLLGEEDAHRRYTTVLRIDAGAPGGVSTLPDGPVETPF